MGGGVRMFGKSASGTMDGCLGWISLPARTTLLGIWHLRNCFGRANAMSEIGHGLYLGRRPLRVPEGCEVVIDLAGELPAADSVRSHEGYRSFSVLDRSVCDDDEFLELVRALASDPRPKLVHCAQGYGRSAEVVVALLVAMGQVPTIDAAIEMVRSRRPGIRLTRSQLAQLRRCEPALREARNAAT